jgi:hypothetical protein
VEAIAEAEVGMDEGFPWERLLQLRTQLADVDVDRALLLAERAVPDDGVELFPAYDAPAAPPSLMISCVAASTARLSIAEKAGKSVTGT